MKLLGFAGPAGAGKTTCANMASEVNLSFARPMKDCLSQLFDFSFEQLYTMEGKETIDERYGVTPRLIMQRFGTEFVRTTVPDLWLILMEKTIKEHKDFDVVTVDDLRFSDECDLIRKLGGTVVHVQGRTTYSNEHESEAPLWVSKKDRILDNSGTLDDLRRKVNLL